MHGCEREDTKHILALTEEDANGRNERQNAGVCRKCLIETMDEQGLSVGVTA